MFVAESRLMAHVSTHPAILTVFDAGVAADGRLYLVMEFCPGGYGDTYRTTRIPVPEVLRTGVRMASALETAHRANVLHRDVKPANILFTGDGRAKLGDFGLARCSRMKAVPPTALHATPDYVAPEILDGLPGDSRSDIFSLGATLYHALTGKPPHQTEGCSLEDLRVIKSRSVKVAPTRRDISPETLLLINRMMECDPSLRPSGHARLIGEFRRVLASKQGSGRMKMPPTSD
jgi:serine/threonine protein kinase